MVVAEKNAYETGARRVGQSTPYREELKRFWEYSEEYFMEEIFLRFPQPIEREIGNKEECFIRRKRKILVHMTLPSSSIINRAKRKKGERICRSYFGF
jgi:hypothetical protein